jgi:hypothetical protein
MSNSDSTVDPRDLGLSPLSSGIASDQNNRNLELSAKEAMLHIR